MTTIPLVVSVIDIKEERRDLLAHRKIRCNEKDISQLFSFLAHELLKNDFRIENIDDKNLRFELRHRVRKIDGNIEDLSEENKFEVSIYSSSSIFPRKMKEWMNKQFLGLKYSLWTFIVVIAAILSTLIAIGRKDPDFLRYLGISLIAVGGISIILFFILRKSLINISLRKKENAEKIVQLVNDMIEKYSLEKPTSKFCWNCFNEVKREIKVCPKCKSKIIN